MVNFALESTRVFTGDFALGTAGGGGGVDVLYAKRDGQSISIKIAIN